MNRFDTALYRQCSRLMTAWNRWNYISHNDANEIYELYEWFKIWMAGAWIKRYLRD
jgi:hypothetical protein